MRFVIASVIVLAQLMANSGLLQAAAARQVDYNFDVKPILSDRCYACHGPDASNREADLRLDTRKGAFAALSDDVHIISPGRPDRSELYLRISEEDEDLRMPPVDSKLSLSAEEIETLRLWIEQGAEWKQHWSYLPIRSPAIPDVQDDAWPDGPIDYFVLARLEEQGLRPSKQADKTRLIRRLSFDLTGLPPTLEEVEAFLADSSEGAYETQVDRLLNSPRFGERMAVDWLDVARYADTYGYQSDVFRAMWPWRDWVIRALNDNMPFDQFVTWQLAGDLLPDSTQDQMLATAFNRHHRQTNEGGSIEEEYRVEYVSDRTDTLGAALLGITLGCARCHDHKYDPFTQKEYYQLFAFFNSIDESGLYSHFTDAVPTPTLVLKEDAQREALAKLEQQIRAAEARLEELRQQQRGAFDRWLTEGQHEAEIRGLIGDYPLESIEEGKVANRADEKSPGNISEDPQPIPGKRGGGLKLSGENNINVSAGGDFTRDHPFSVAIWINTPDEKDRAVILHRSRAWTDAGSRGYQLLLEKGRLSWSLIHFWPGNAIRIRMDDPVAIGQWIHVAMTYDGSSRAEGLRLYVDGERVPCEIVRDNLTKNITGGGAKTLDVGQRFRDRGFKNGLVDELQVFDRCLTPIEVAQVHDQQSLDQLLSKTPDGLPDVQKDQLYEYYLTSFDEEYAKAADQLKSVRQQRSKLRDPLLEVMVMRELPEPRQAYLLKRGSYNAPGEPVEPAVPASLPPFPDHMPRNRLGLAKWLTSPEHPLLARVTVNRMWQSLFGQGLVATPEDLGSQGQLPSHPKVLDWLSRSFIDSGWDVKQLVKTIVMSSTYRQDSACSEPLRSKDPDNVLLGRGPRYRLPAEMLRDNALLASGLLVDKVGGPAVKPYQPDGLWKEKSGKTYTRDKGEGSHRRSLYTYWKRTSPPPAMMTLDAAKRDVCQVKRQTTATPLQALVLLNDPQYVEASRSGRTCAVRSAEWRCRFADHRDVSAADQPFARSRGTECAATTA